MTPEETYEQIDDFLLDKMTAEQKRAFERRIEEDEGLARQVEDHRIHHEVMDRLVERDLRSDMDAWDRAPEPEKNNRRKYWWLVLLPLLLLGIYYWFYQPVELTSFPTPDPMEVPILDDLPSLESSDPSDKQDATPVERPIKNSDQEESPSSPGKRSDIVASARINFQLYGPIGEGGLKSADPPSGDKIMMLIDDLKGGDTSQVINRAGILIEQKGYELTARQLLGSLYFLQGRFADAIPLYRHLSESELLAIRQEAEWNLIQLYLLTDPESEQIDDLLTKIGATEKHRFEKEAQQLIQQRSGTK